MGEDEGGGRDENATEIRYGSGPISYMMNTKINTSIDFLR
jgi:hypothetical protein